MNMTLLGSWDDNALPTSGTTAFNDVWGYAANGREYAIMGSMEGFYIFDITTPTTPTIVTFQAGASNFSLWRDFKTYQNYLYAVSDQGAASSLQIYDLSGLPSSVTKVYDSQAHFSTCHNIYINEESGRLYAAGTTVNPSGVVILDIGTDPSSPTALASPVFGSYVHDVYIHKDTIVAFMGNSGIGMFDFSNLASPALIDLVFTYVDPGYCHSGWATSDFKHLYWGTETNGTSIKVSDFTSSYNLDVVTTFRSERLSPADTTSVPHNFVVNGDFLYVSYYHDGVVVYDISDRLNPVVAAYYDTYPQNTDYAGLRGCWGIYPNLPSGNILASDKENGLFILGSNLTFPVELTDFRAELISDEVKLQWTTVQERNNERFEVERSADGVQFEKIAVVAGQGDTDQETDYVVWDNFPLDGRSYYRLKQVDSDGETTYTEVVSIRRGEELRFLGVAPNPVAVGDDIQVRLDLVKGERVEFLVTDLLGRILHQEVRELSPGLQSVSLSTMGWTNGAYLVKASAGARSHAQKVLVNQ